MRAAPGFISRFIFLANKNMASTIAQKFRNVGRLTQIVNIFARYGFRKELQRSELADYLKAEGTEGSEVTAGNLPDSREELSGAKRLTMAFEELGPTFVKLGQLLASREDILPRNVVLEFKRLQDQVKPFSREQLDKIIATEFKGKHSEIFATLEYPPLGAASIGQVHRAILQNGREVVLKIQRPEVENLIRTDLSILAGLATVLEGAIPELRLLRPSIVVEELKKSLYAELDYFREAANTERMRALFEGNDEIHIPEILRDYSTRTVLCMEFIRGKKLTSLTAEDRPEHLVKVGVRAFLDMTFKFGMFHADLHPGNFIYLESGELAILDFGLTARLTREMRNTMSFMFLSLVNEDLETFSRLFIELTEAGMEVDRPALEAEIRDAVDTAFSLPLRDLQIGRLLMNVAKISAAKHAPVSRELVLFFRALIALESFGRTLDPGFQILREAGEYAKTLPARGMAKGFFENESLFMLRDSQALLRELPLTMRLLAKRLQAGNLSFRIQSDELGSLAREVDRASNRLSLALLLGALVLGSSIVTYGKQGKLFDSLATLGLMGFGIAAFLGLWLVVSILRSGRFK